jgi:hypothetical protein
LSPFQVLHLPVFLQNTQPSITRAAGTGNDQGGGVSQANWPAAIEAI